jgi:hypothetical protein
MTFISLLTTPFISAKDGELSADKRLVSAATTFIDLHLCANVAWEYESNSQLNEHFREMAFKLQDLIAAMGWTEEEFSTAIVLVYEAGSGITGGRYTRKLQPEAFFG